MSEQQQSKIGFKAVAKATLTTIIIIIVVVGILAALPKIGASSWVFMILIFMFLAIEQFNVARLPHAIVGAFVGITLGFGLNLLTMLFTTLFGTIGSIIGPVVYLIIIISALTTMMLGKLAIALNNTTWLFVLIMAMVSGVADIKYLSSDYFGFAIASVLLIIVAFAMKKSAASKKAKASTQDQ
jgi:hypothetical protein